MIMQPLLSHLPSLHQLYLKQPLCLLTYFLPSFCCGIYGSTSLVYLLHTLAGCWVIDIGT
ncbi:uncharacterized protein BO88DRAFT_39416 [Aspergillus vadensis CBS 113365]|uniref:Uncharacterized protein n=1 Tax=Aspergillus vadensis (strain CBS 113365 / IMI 142717 / IBT 24658) TaxID=1448311 RepID=A0A319BAR9_ASPVC|nr:hypothetical protein BO88DRAFT_39416 [Aspergillus vadensis CBS 113365]PYH69695.1 hypothetical protein BO88DRAFT_39416 [Aspergillus vadensis CBS 113365]